MACSMALSVAGCGQPLGVYDVEGVEVVSRLPAPFDAKVQPGYDQYLEVRVRSKTSLTAIGDKVDGVYIDADFCPLKDPQGVIALGPVSNDGHDLGLPSSATALHPDSDGLFHYRFYIPVSYRARAVKVSGQIQLPTYDLRTANRDVCMRLFAPGYHLIASRSEMIAIPAATIAGVFKVSAAGADPKTAPTAASPHARRARPA